MLNFLCVALCILHLVPKSTSDICATCSCFDTDKGPIINCHNEHLANNEMFNFGLMMLDEHQRLNKLILSKNEITNLHLHILAKLKLLKHLDLSNNLMENMHTGLFKDLTNLEYLDFSMNRLTMFDDALLKHLPTLSVLNVSHNHISTLEHTIGETQANLISLDLSHNNISQFSSNSFESLRNLEYLDLSFNKIESFLNDTLIHLVSLRTLYINNNKLTFLDLSVFPKSLLELNSGFNNIIAINYTSSKIQKLSVEFNNLSEISKDLDLFAQLYHLNVSGNKLTTFPNIVLANLKILDVSRNNLFDIPHTLSISNFPKLDSFDISENPIRKLKFSSKLRLRTLTAKNLPSLEIISEDAFLNLLIPTDECINITVSNNKKLSVIHEKSMNHLHICSLDLSNNNFVYVSQNLIASNSDFSVYSIDLQGNPFNCNCSLQWMLKSLVPQLYKYRPRLLNNLRCALPSVISNMRMVHWYGWQEEVFCLGMSHYKENLIVQMTSVSNAKPIMLESSTGLLTVVGSALGVLTILVIVGLLLSRRISIKRRRTNRRF